jgi:xanthine/CO dehydrogenase XdhC/CoxF family maturation factor
MCCMAQVDMDLVVAAIANAELKDTQAVGPVAISLKKNVFYIVTLGSTYTWALTFEHLRQETPCSCNRHCSKYS